MCANELPEELNPAVLKRNMRKRFLKQRNLFFALCSEKDRELVMCKKELNIDDFERIQYLMHTLGFEDLHNGFLMQHDDLLEKLSSEIENKLDDIVADIEKELDKVKQWNNQFIEQLPTDKMKTFVQKTMNIS